MGKNGGGGEGAFSRQANKRKKIKRKTSFKRIDRYPCMHAETYG